MMAPSERKLLCHHHFHHRLHHKFRACPPPPPPPFLRTPSPYFTGGFMTPHAYGLSMDDIHPGFRDYGYFHPSHQGMMGREGWGGSGDSSADEESCEDTPEFMTSGHGYGPGHVGFRRGGCPPRGFDRGNFGRGGSFDRGGSFGRGGFGRHRCHHPMSGRWDDDSDSNSHSDSDTDYEATFELMKLFKKKDICIRLVGRHLAVEAEGKARRTSPCHHPHLERSCRRYFVEHHILPKSADRSMVTATWNEDGVLTITAPHNTNQSDDNAPFEQEVEIQDQTSSRGESREQVGDIMQDKD